MRIVVLGAGVVGVTTAWYLAERGHDVTVIDRAADVALETSFANGGQISATGSAPWAAPGVPWQAFKWLLRADAPLKWSPRADPAQWKWLIAFVRRCTARAHTQGIARNLALGQLSLAELQSLRARLNLEYHQQTKGILKVAKSQTDLEELRVKAEQLRAMGAQARFVTAAQCIEIDPALEPAVAAGEIIGGIHFAADESGDAHAFTQALAAKARETGVTFVFDTTVIGIQTNGQTDGQKEGARAIAVRTSAGPVPCDHVVICLGVGSVAIMRALGVSLPIYPIKGYSVTVPVAGSNMAPTISLTDEERRVVITRLGNSVRVAGMAELAGNDLRINPRRAAAVRKALNDLFPALANAPDTQVWTGLRPMTPDGAPIIGRAEPWQNISLNSGHGTYGWTMACGSARVLADEIDQKPGKIDSESFSLARFSR